MENTQKKSSFVTKLGSDLVLGILVVVLSVFTALSAYQSTVYDGEQADMNAEGQQFLTDSNSLYLEANQFVLYDYSMYDGWYINKDQNEELAGYFHENFSDELLESLSREQGPFDDPYYDEMYVDAENAYDEAMQRFEAGRRAGYLAQRMQLVVFIMAVGLALSAYASLLKSENKMRIVLAICALVSAITSLVFYLSV